MYAAILAAAGTGERFGSAKNKLLVELCGLPVVARSARALATLDDFSRIIVVTAATNSLEIARVAGVDQRFEFIRGGATRQESIWLGLEALRSDPPEIVLIHDAARCLVSTHLLGAALQAAKSFPAVTAALELRDSIHQVDHLGNIERPLDRSKLRAVQTPQAFNFQTIYLAHQRAHAQGLQVTDDASLVLPVHCIAGEASNIKITTGDDLDLARFYLEKA